MKSQYMIVFAPKGAAKTKIDAIRADIAVEYFTTNALDNPAHITLIPPFHATDEQIEKLIPEIIEELKFERSFEVKLQGYSFFSKNRVAFLDVKPPKPLADIRSMIMEVFKSVEPSIEFMRMNHYNPNVTVACRDITPYQFSRLQVALANKNDTINWLIDCIEVWIRVEKQWLVHDTLELTPDYFIRTIKDGHIEYEFTFHPVRSEELSELYYLVTLDGVDFVMAYDNDELQFKVQGKAPQEASVFEDKLAQIIEEFN